MRIMRLLTAQRFFSKSKSTRVRLKIIFDVLNSSYIDDNRRLVYDSRRSSLVQQESF